MPTSAFGQSAGYLGLHGQYPIAHRGGSAEHLENSLSAFQNALALGINVIETDVQATADGVLAVIHDPNLDRTATLPAGAVSSKVSDLAWAELSTFKLRNGEAILRLEELLELSPNLRLNVDPKTDRAVEPLIRLLAKHSAAERICVGSFSTDRLRAIRAALPGQATGLGVAEVRHAMLASRFGLRLKLPKSAVAAQVPTNVARLPVVTPKFVETIQSSGRHVQVWTIDDPDEMRRLYGMGVNAVMTDRPTQLKTTMQELGIWR